MMHPDRTPVVPRPASKGCPACGMTKPADDLAYILGGAYWRGLVWSLWKATQEALLTIMMIREAWHEPTKRSVARRTPRAGTNARSAAA